MLLFREFERFWLLSAVTHLMILRIIRVLDKSAGLLFGTCVRVAHSMTALHHQYRVRDR